MATVTADKNDIAKLLGLGEVGVPRISHDSGAKMVHSRLFLECVGGLRRAVHLVALSPSQMRGERCRGEAGNPAIDAICERVCCTLFAVLDSPLVGFSDCWCVKGSRAECRRQSGDRRVSHLRHVARDLTHVGK